MRPVVFSRRRRRAASVLVLCAALAAGTTFGKGSPLDASLDPLRGEHRVDLDGAPDVAAAKVLQAAWDQVGDTYVWGGNGPDAWDCSGFTSLWRTVGGAKKMPRVSRDQQAWTIPVGPSDIERGDLVFFGHPVTHVGIVSGGGYMLDAAQSKKGVVHRKIWSTGVVRYGRVPRPGMPKVKPWTPPPLPPATPSAPVADSAAAAAAAPATKPTAKPVAKPAKPVAKPAKPVAKPVKPVAKPAKPAAKPEVLSPLKGLPSKQKHLSSLVAYKAAAAGKALAGKPAGPGAWGDVGLVQHAFRTAGGPKLPTDRAKIVSMAKRVKLSDARIGDLVVYSRPDTPHLGIYLGGGKMVDASAKQGRVVIRPVYAAGSVRVMRLR